MNTLFSNLENIYFFIKEKTKRFVSWKSDSVFYWFIKLIITAGIFILFFLFFRFIIFPLLGIIILLILLFADNLSESIPLNSQNTYLHYTARELLFFVLQKNAIVIDAETPATVEDITPTKYLVVNQINNCTQYSFIIRHMSDYDTNFLQKKNDLNILIEQKLSGGFTNIAQPYYKDMPVFRVREIRNDSNHLGYFRIDIVPITNDRAYEYIRNIEFSEYYDSQLIEKSPDDEDF